MANAKVKTVVTNESVADFINKIEDETKQNDCFAIINLMRKVSGFEEKMWGPSIIGFGSYHYKYESGREGDAPLVGFSPRKAEISLYLAQGFKERQALLEKFGKHKTAKACIYIKKLSDIDTNVLEEMIGHSIAYIKELYGN